MITIEGVLDKLAREAREKLRDMDENYNIVITGLPGKGKSGSALTIAKLIDPDFQVDQVVFTVEEMLDLLNSKPPRYWKGRCIVFDEAGAGRSAHESQMKINIAMNKVVQTYRYLNICMIYTASFVNFIIKNDRMLMHVNIKLFHKDVANKEVWAKWYNLNFNPKANRGQGETFTVFPRMTIKGRTFRIKQIFIPHPPMDVWREYKKRERPYKKLVRKQAAEIIAAAKEKKKRLPRTEQTKQTIEKALKKLRKDSTKYRGSRGALNDNRIAVGFGVGMKVAKRIRAAAEMEGI